MNESKCDENLPSAVKKRNLGEGFVGGRGIVISEDDRQGVVRLLQ
jgi:hypothetical protein